MRIEQILSRKVEIGGRVVQISVDIRYAWHCMNSQKITTIEELEEAFNNYYGTEKTDTTTIN
jgi:hypothetical protein